MKKYFIASSLVFIFFTNLTAQFYISHSYLGLKSAFGTLYNPYTNGALADVRERVGLTNMIEYGAEGMGKDVYVIFKSDVFGLVPDYFIKAANKNNRKTVYGALMEEFHSTYNAASHGLEYNASFTDFDILGGNLSYGYRYVYFGINTAWSMTAIDAYRLVSNTKRINIKPGDYFGFNDQSNFSFGFNTVLWNNNTITPIRLLIAYDWLLMRDYYQKWHIDRGNRLMIDLQGTLPFFLLDKNKKKKEEYKNWRRGVYLGIVYKRLDIDYMVPILVNEMREKNFIAGLINFKLGYSW